METIKKWFGIVSAALVAIFGVVVYILYNKKNIKGLEAQVDQANTQKKADVLESEIKELQDKKDISNKEAEELDKILKAVDSKRQDVKEEAAKVTSPKQIEDYWNKQ